MTIYVFYSIKENNSINPNVKPEEIIIYAWTDIKLIKDIFIESRNMNRFVYKKLKFETNDMLDSFTSIYSSQKLNIFNLPYDKDKSCDVVMTNQEEYECVSDFINTLNNIINPYCTHSYDILKPKYIEALDKVLYCTFHKMNYSDDIEYRELVEDSLTTFGLSVKGFIQEGFIEKNLNLFIYKYKQLLK